MPTRTRTRRLEPLRLECRPTGLSPATALTVVASPIRADEGPVHVLVTGTAHVEGSVDVDIDSREASIVVSARGVGWSLFPCGRSVAG
jgi:hypothetical protein